MREIFSIRSVQRTLNCSFFHQALFWKIAKDVDSSFPFMNGLLGLPRSRNWRSVMGAKTCAACDCKLDANAIKVKIGGNAFEWCSDECRQKLKNAHASAKRSSSVLNTHK